MDLSLLMNRSALFVSVLLHPLLLPFYLFLLYTSFWYPLTFLSTEGWWILSAVVFIATFCIPVILVMMLKTMGLVHSLHLNDRKERTVPFLVTAVIYYLTSRLLQRYSVPVEFTLMMLGTTGMILIAMGINFRWKISIHMMGIGGVAGMMLGLARYAPERFFIPFVVVFTLAGLLGVARIVTGSHRPAEVYAGFLAGFVWFLGLFLIVL